MLVAAACTLDTNIIIDYYCRRNPFYENARELFRSVFRDGLCAYVTSKTVTDTYYILQKELGKHSATKKVRSLLEVCAVLPIDEEDCWQPFNESFGDYEDAVILASAARNNVPYIVTRNMTGFTSIPDKVEIMTPGQFLEEFAAFREMFLDTSYLLKEEKAVQAYAKLEENAAKGDGDHEQRG